MKPAIGDGGALGLLLVVLFSALRTIHGQPNIGIRLEVDLNVTSCPYVIDTEHEALERAADASMKGNIVKVDSFYFGRTGNHMISLYRSLAVGYCCKSKLVWLPPKDDVLAPGILKQGAAGPVLFDFSSAPDSAGFDSGSCTTDFKWGGGGVFYMEGLDDPHHDYYTPDLRDCVTTAPRLLRCEAAYLFPRDVDVCRAPLRGERGEEDDDEEGQGEEGMVQVQQDGQDRGAGNLVVHVRSGDIFNQSGKDYSGQPPLQFYLLVMRDRKWDRIDFVTWAEDEAYLNPVIPELQARLANGDLPDNVHIHTDRSMAQDLQAMMCADALVLARSTLRYLTGYHSIAKQIYSGVRCDGKLGQLARLRPEAQIYGVDMPRGEYSVYDIWDNTPEQRHEIIAYSNITGLERCTSGGLP